jgi:RimJ/RimL family protein N-acetyltransferase
MHFITPFSSDVECQSTFAPPPEGLCYELVHLNFARMVPGDPYGGDIPFYHFRILTPDDEDAGHINLKMGHTDHIRLYAGHIGFGIHPDQRGQGLSFQACRALAPFVRTLFTSVIITADPDNEPSIRTILRLGSQFLEQVAVPESDPQYWGGSRFKNRYEWIPQSP